MDAADPILIGGFAAFTIAIVVYFAGVRLTALVPFLRAWSIPEPVSGGLLAAAIAWAVVMLTGREVAWDLAARDFLLVYFFTTVGLSARLSDLVRGGPVLAVMLALTLGYMVVQAGIGILAALAFGLPPQAGTMLGTASLIGGHGTAIAWGPVVQQTHGVPGAAELGIAMATLGLIAASVLGGPMARFLIDRHRLAIPGADPASFAAAAVSAEGHAPGRVSNGDFLRAILWINIAVGLGTALHGALTELGVMLPLFVPCLLSGIALSNTVPRLLPRIEWPAGTPAMELIREFSLSVFLSMSLMSMELWTLAAHAGVLALGIVLQSAAAAGFILLVVFRAMGRDYFAAVVAAGFAGFSLGATPTAIANMTAVTQRYGPAPLAFIVLPLVSAFFVDLANALVIQLSLGL
ncbi:sodium/glutamate symporter [Mangrovicoccus algicola]|uniref:Sodium/glutamate symporter n=1 Tax=Mangrovicoccus algicola TaxID=2771008 RepID=A0A8J6YVL2_9RHOB|nr:sodium/glutamate symporter [Mangrovicoccus algicola]MBE3636878.1 sodium/glutamate symporter [Mangrovicoccus algicola]